MPSHWGPGSPQYHSFSQESAVWRQGRGRSSEAVCRAQPSVGSASGQQLQVADSLVRLSQDGQQNGWGGQAERLERYQEAHLIQRPDAQRHLLEQAYVEYQRQKHQQQLQEAYVEYQRQKRLEQYHHEIETNQRSQEQQSHPLPEQQNQHASVMYSAGWNKSRSEIVDLLLRLTANMENGGRTAGRSGSSTRSVELAPTAHKAMAKVPAPPGLEMFAVASGDLASTHATCTRESLATCTRESLEAWDSEDLAQGLSREGRRFGGRPGTTYDSLDRLSDVEEVEDAFESSEPQDAAAEWDEHDRQRMAFGSGPFTTLMVRGIPLEYSQEMLMEEWPMDGSYDLLYMPRSSGGKTNLGYVFINFVTEERARAFRARWHSRILSRFPGQKSLGVSLADAQGFEATVAQLKAKPVGRMRTRKCLPVLMMGGRLVSLEDL